MPRPGPRRRAVPLRLSEEEERPARDLAIAEHAGNLSRAIRQIIAEWDELVRPTRKPPTSGFST